MVDHIRISVFELKFQYAPRRVAATMPRNKAPVTELGSIYVHGEKIALIYTFAMTMESRKTYMDQVVVLKMKLKKTWTKSARLEVSDQLVKKV